MAPLDDSRYSRQIKLPQVGAEGQQKIHNSRVLIIGMGGLGSPAALYLAAAGVGHLTISDFDVVEASNLQRQIIHANDAQGELKTHSAKQSTARANPNCEVTTIDHELQDEELLAHIQSADIVLDCSDNFPTRFAINRHCVHTQTPLVSAAAIRLEGQIMAYLPNPNSPCYQCLYGEQYTDAATCEMEGILGPVVGVMGTLQALYALLILLGKSDQIQGQLLLFDALNMHWQPVQVPKNPQCPVCSNFLPT